jgi:diguanylate cyclase (GGDEF)-like protein
MLTDPSYDISYDRIVRLLKLLTGASAAAFTVLDGGRQFFKAHEGTTDRELPRNITYCNHTIEQTDVMVVNNADLDPRFAGGPLLSNPDTPRFYAGVAVRAPSGLPLGSLCVLDAKPRELRDNERQVLTDLREMLEESLVLRSLSVIDALTGLFSRRHFEDVVSREWHRGFAAQQPLALFMVDIDHFKKYNDTYGHAGGDDCLRQVASVLRVGARRVGDVLARIGGEEFVLLLPDTDAAAALEQAAQIRAALAALQLPHRGSSLGQVTISVGIAIVEQTAETTLAQAMEAADAALYRAKNEGRDRAVVAG